MPRAEAGEHWVGIGGGLTTSHKSQTTYSSRSNTVMRFPTGLNRQLPSGVNSTLPPLYTVPHRFENSKFCRGIRRGPGGMGSRQGRSAS
jgi:hypothetical protein